jgi:hypothetical protein
MVDLMLGLAMEVAGAAFGNDLVEPAVEPRQSVGNTVRGGGCGGGGFAGALGRVGPCHAFELAGQIVEAIADRGEFVAMDVLVVVRLPI